MLCVEILERGCAIRARSVTNAYICLLLLGITAGARAQDLEPYSPEAVSMRAAAARAGVPEHQLPRRTLAEARAHKRGLAEWEGKLGSSVRDRRERLEAAGVSPRTSSELAVDYATEVVPIDDRARLLVEMKVTSVEPFDEAFFDAFGGQLVNSALGFGLVVAWVPVDHLRELAERLDVRRIHGVGPAHVDIGSQQTEGDAIHNAATARTQCNIDGTGQSVGAISDGSVKSFPKDATPQLSDTSTPTSCPADPVQEVIGREWTATDECGNSESCVQEITVLKLVGELDIKPGSCPNAHNPRSKGLLPVSLVGTADFDVTDVDLATVVISRTDCVGGAVAPSRARLSDTATPFAGAPCDCHTLTGDGVLDLSMKFERTQLRAALGLDAFAHGDSVELTVSGSLTNGCEFVATDCISIRGN